jgi:hypothetical protein
LVSVLRIQDDPGILFHRRSGALIVAAHRGMVAPLVLYFLSAGTAGAVTFDDDLPIVSKNQRFEAAPGLRGDSTVVTRKRKLKRTEKIWEKPGWDPVSFVSDDGNYLVTGYDGNNLLKHQHAANEVMLVFYRRGTRLKSVRLDEVVVDQAHLRTTDSGVLWGSYEGFLTTHRFAVDTVEQRRLIYDVTTGALVEVLPSPSPLVEPVRVNPSALPGAPKPRPLPDPPHASHGEGER